MKYFSIDYRSLPSGMGQIIDTRKPEKIGDQYNFILVDYGDNPHNDISYVMTKYFYTDEGWSGPVMAEIFQFLKEQKVTHVCDSELSYNHEGGNQEDFHGLFTLDRWIEIISKLI